MLFRCVGSTVGERIFLPAVLLPPEPAENPSESRRRIAPGIVEGERAVRRMIIPPLLDAINLTTSQAGILGNSERNKRPSDHWHACGNVPPSLRIKITIRLEYLPVCRVGWVWCAAAFKFYKFGRHKLLSRQINAIFNDCVANLKPRFGDKSFKGATSKLVMAF